MYQFVLLTLYFSHKIYSSLILFDPRHLAFQWLTRMDGNWLFPAIPNRVRIWWKWVKIPTCSFTKPRWKTDGKRKLRKRGIPPRLRQFRFGLDAFWPSWTLLSNLPPYVGAQYLCINFSGYKSNLQIGKSMNARLILLTHFSGRYKMIPLPSEDLLVNVGIAFDFASFSFIRWDIETHRVSMISDLDVTFLS